MFEGLMRHDGFALPDVTGIMISSVVPTVNFTIEHMCRSYIGVEPRFLVPGVKTGLNIRYENPRELGSDRIANAVAAAEIYGGPCIVIDFGSATNYGAISEKGEFLGGAIAPGIKMSAEALYTGTAKLPRIELVCPPSIIARTTVTNIRRASSTGMWALWSTSCARCAGRWAARRRASSPRAAWRASSPPSRT